MFEGLRPKFHQGSRTVDHKFVTLYDVDNPDTCIYRQGNDTALAIDILNRSDDIDFGLDIFSSSFQERKFITAYEKEIKSSFDITYGGGHSNNLFIHVRLGDASHVNPGTDYYRRCIADTKFNKGYISSDSMDNNMINELIDEFKLIPYSDSPINTINFGKDFGNLVLSDGTFSWWIAALSNAETVHYPITKKKWCGDIWVYDRWAGHNV